MSALNSFTKISEEIRSGNIGSVYFLYGNEPFFIDELTRQLQHATCFEPKELNTHTFAGDSTSVAEVISQARQIPMQGKRQLIILKEAQHLSKSISGINTYIQKPAAFSVLIVVYVSDKFSAKSKWFQSFSGNPASRVLASNTLYENHLPAFISSISKSHRLKISESAVKTIIQHTGNDLYGIKHTVEQLEIKKYTGMIEPENIKALNLGEKAYTEFELQKAVLLGQKELAFAIVHHFSKNERKHPLVKSVALLYRMVKNLLLYSSCENKSAQDVSKILGIHPFFVRDYQEASRRYSLRKTVQMLEKLHQTDLKSKGIERSTLSSQNCASLKEWLSVVFSS